MVLIAEMSTPSSDFLLGGMLEERPDVVVRVERMVVDGSADVTPYFWVEASDPEAVEPHLVADHSLEDLEMLESHDEERLYRGSWQANVAELVVALDDVQGTVLEAVGRDGHWHLRVMFDDHGAVSTFHDLVSASDMEFSLDRLHTSDSPTEYAKFDLTDRQREALVAAHDLGYFAVPREASLADVAGALDISRNAASARLRRGTDAVIANAVAHDGGTDDA